MTDTLVFYGGYKTLPPPKYELVEKETGPWYWRKTEYYIEMDYVTVGPYSTREEALSHIALAKSI